MSPLAGHRRRPDKASNAMHLHTLLRPFGRDDASLPLHNIAANFNKYTHTHTKINGCPKLLEIYELPAGRIPCDACQVWGKWGFAAQRRRRRSGGFLRRTQRLDVMASGSVRTAPEPPVRLSLPARLKKTLTK